MKFGKVSDPEAIDFTLPAVPPETERILAGQGSSLSSVFVGCAKWNKQDLKGFYPKGVKDELAYYSRQFNAIELNATFYNLYKEEQIRKWKDKTPDGFMFFPKLPRYVSHLKRLRGHEHYLEDYLVNIQAFDEKLGMLFLQMHDNFGPTPENTDRLKNFITQFPQDLPLAVELRHTDWHNNADIASDIYALFEKFNVTNMLVDTAGRRDLLHMRLTTSSAFVRYVGANHSSDYDRLDDWVELIKQWAGLGLERLYFFIHQNLEKESPLLAVRFINNLNKALGTQLKPPVPSPVQTTPLGF